MSYYHSEGTVTVLHGDCLNELRTIPDNSIDAVVTDPPYGLSNTSPAQVADTITRWVQGEREYLPTGRGFMGAEWDAFVPPVAVWDECLRVLKPGGHLLAFAGSRTHDLMTLGIRLAGFEIRDSVAWAYGSGMPKSMNVSRAIDMGRGKNRERQLEFTSWMRSTGITAATINEATGTRMASHYLTDGSQPAIATADLFDLLRPHLPEVPEHIERLVAERTGIEWTDYVKRQVVGVKERAMSGWSMDGTTEFADREITAPHSDEAKQWDGWGTALKPSFEPITLARKPLDGTVAENVIKWGVGGINIDATRIGNDTVGWGGKAAGGQTWTGDNNGLGKNSAPRPVEGRWPANLVLDEDQAAELDKQSGDVPGAVGMTLYGAGSSIGPRGLKSHGNPIGQPGQRDFGGAARFFYVAKPDHKERPKSGGVQHPTVKPLSLMQWLIRLVVPEGGTVLDPFAGSGTTLEAAVREHVQSIGIEREDDYLPLIKQRLERAVAVKDELTGFAAPPPKPKSDDQTALF